MGAPSPTEKRDLRPIFLVCDTCVFTKDFSLKNEDWKIVHSVIFTGDSTFVVPRPVLQEVKKKIMDFGLRGIQKAKIELGKPQTAHLAGVLREDELERELKKYSENYKEVVEQRFGKQKIRYLEDPKISSSEMFEKAVSIKRPFKEKADNSHPRPSSGFRDAYILESVKELAMSNPRARVIFMSTNTSDFAGSDESVFHDDILDELSMAGVSNVEYFGSFNLVKDLLKKAKSDAHFLDLFNDEVMHELMGDLSSKMPDSDELYEAGGNSDTVEIGYAEAQSISVKEVYCETQDTWLVEGTVRITGSFAFYLDKHDYYSLCSEETDEFIGCDTDWNDYVVRVEKEFDQEFNFLSSVEIVEKDGLIEPVKILDFLVAGVDFLSGS